MGRFTRERPARPTDLAPVVAERSPQGSPRPSVIGVCGGSGSGKTTLALRLHEALGPDQAVTISFDSYYHDLSHLAPQRRAEVNFDHPDSLDGELLARHLEALAAGQDVAVPIYDFANYTRSGDHQLVPSRPFVIVEGILLFAFAEIRQRLDHLVFRHCDEATRAERRLRRDVAERGRTPESVRRQWDTTVAPMHDQFVEPSARFATAVTTADQDLDATVRRLAADFRNHGALAPA